MAKLLALRVLSGKMSFAEIQNNYSKYAEEVLKIIDEKGYEIDSDGHCVKKKGESAWTIFRKFLYCLISQIS